MYQNSLVYTENIFNCKQEKIRKRAVLEQWLEMFPLKQVKVLYSVLVGLQKPNKEKNIDNKLHTVPYKVSLQF